MTEKTETLQEYEELFAHRFSAEDPEYQKYQNRAADPPPLVEDWRGRAGGNQRGRDNRYPDRRGHRGRGWGGDRDRDRSWGGDRREQNWHDRDRDRDRDRDGDRDRDRHWGHGSGQSGSNQGSHQQRPHYDRY
ncbi:RNA guanine-N7 methyltransferase activating subunit-like isoform X4 [Hippoglossus hippoglossus]|uniref:RNA guanine-N7 methyltransferase activating subunit-like isoform X4 n=1 Tax=Hippoglossus hippoglossus TaxID=8267 RepID=UPI00148D9029|nr:RNA guanine-N7 methyltransferase activating subunit-like isoform X4 [Hippoglossus hippoglossus]